MSTATLKRRLARVEALLPGPTCDALNLYFSQPSTREHIFPRSAPPPGRRPVDVRCFMLEGPCPDLSGDREQRREQLAAHVPRKWANVVLNAREVVLQGCMPIDHWEEVRAKRRRLKKVREPVQQILNSDSTPRTNVHAQQRATDDQATSQATTESAERNHLASLEPGDVVEIRVEHEKYGTMTAEVCMAAYQRINREVTAKSSTDGYISVELLRVMPTMVEIIKSCLKR